MLHSLRTFSTLLQRILNLMPVICSRNAVCQPEDSSPQPLQIRIVKNEAMPRFTHVCHLLDWNASTASTSTWEAIRLETEATVARSLSLVQLLGDATDSRRDFVILLPALSAARDKTRRVHGYATLSDLELRMLIMFKLYPKFTTTTYPSKDKYYYLYVYLCARDDSGATDAGIWREGLTKWGE